jgi:hypothetical protein
MKTQESKLGGLVNHVNLDVMNAARTVIDNKQSYEIIAYNHLVLRVKSRP